MTVQASRATLQDKDIRRTPRNVDTEGTSRSGIRPDASDVDLTSVPAHSLTARGHSTTGAPLETATRREMETRFGDDFGDVRVHVGSSADAATRELRASAYTFGSDIAFRDGRYQPGTSAGDQLLAHELAHVVQQRRGGTADPAQLEHGAHRAAGSYAEGGPITVAGAGPRQVACQNEDEWEKLKEKQTEEELKEHVERGGQPYRTPGRVPDPKPPVPYFPEPAPKPAKPKAAQLAVWGGCQPRR
ncbi:uncharacterized protein DUF4157 [Nocardia tenerifensis]|uniref:Uncharacterized protein DUF4157 n=2 Tax=Nocardia tenerifensis TaxID=228006 RepID=A0A318JWP3_9NOCA|nr:DUF4157 domain-containing protein [Nocardia tenerifensis]PXX60810.1 uncharacterized protein DUF4157 [Nocardia tenerifensis]